MTNTVKTKKKSLSFFFVKMQENVAFKDVLKYINGLNADNMYSEFSTNNEKIFIRNLKEEDGFILWIISVMRMEWIPKKWKLWQKYISDIWLLNDEWITESTHFIYSPANDVLLLEYNHYWPRIGTLENHINQKASAYDWWNLDCVDFQPILDQNILRKLDDMDSIRMIQISIPRIRVWTIPDDDNSIFSMFKNAEQYQESWVVWIYLKQDKSNKDSLISTEQLKYEIEVLWYNISQICTDFQIRAVSKSEWKTKTYNLLQDKIKTEISVIKLWNTRDIDEKDIFTKMKDIFNIKKQEIIWLVRHD